MIGTSFVAKENREHFHRGRRVNRFENNTILARDLSVVAFVLFSLKRLYEAAKRVLCERSDVVEDTFPPVGRYRFKLSCGAVVDVDDPGHV